MKKLIKFLIIIAGLFITSIFATPSAIIHLFLGVNMYNQKGLIYYMAKPYLFFHTELCNLFNIEPYKENNL